MHCHELTFNLAGMITQALTFSLFLRVIRSRQVTTWPEYHGTNELHLTEVLTITSWLIWRFHPLLPHHKVPVVRPELRHNLLHALLVRVGDEDLPEIPFVQKPQ